MARRVGIGGWVGIGEESTYGTAVASSKYFELAPGDETLQLDQEQLTAAHTVERAVDVADVVKGKRAVSGGLNMDLRFGGGWGVLLEHLAGNRFSTSGTSSPYTHSLAVGDSNAALNGKGLTLEIDRDGILGSSDKTWQYAGIRPTAVEFTVEDNAIMRASWTLMGKDAAYITATTPSYASDNWVKSPSDAASPTASFRFGTDSSETTYTCRRWSVKIEQPHAEIRSVQSATMEEPTLGDRIKVTGSAEVLFQGTSTAGDAFTTAYRAKTAKSLLLMLEGPTASDESILFDMGDVLITAASDPHASDTGALYQTIEFEAYSDGAANPLDITLVNGDSAIFS